MTVESEVVALTPGTHVDFRERQRLASAVVDGGLGDVEPRDLEGDLLPDWYDEWVLAARDRYSELRVHALEVLSERNLQAGRHARAIEAALAAAHSEPLRESTQRVLIRAYLAEGNHAKALDRYHHFLRRLQHEVGARPSDQFHELVRPLGAR